MNDEQGKFTPESIIQQSALPDEDQQQDEILDEGINDLTDAEWDEVTKMQGQNREDGTVITREEAVKQVKESRKN